MLSGRCGASVIIRKANARNSRLPLTGRARISRASFFPGSIGSKVLKVSLRKLHDVQLARYSRFRLASGPPRGRFQNAILWELASGFRGIAPIWDELLCQFSLSLSLSLKGSPLARTSPVKFRCRSPYTPATSFARSNRIFFRRSRSSLRAFASSLCFPGPSGCKDDEEKNRSDRAFARYCPIEAIYRAAIDIVFAKRATGRASSRRMQDPSAR